MNKFISKYEGKLIEDWGCACSDDFKKMARDFKGAVKREFPNAKLTGFKANHYDFSGFIEEGGNCVYVSYNMTRGIPLNLKLRDCSSGILVRTAKDTKDYKGGHNNFCSFYDFKDCVKSVMTKSLYFV